MGINNLEELSLRYNQNTISIETGIIDYYNNGKGHIRYKLEGQGKEEGWQYGPAYYTIRYDGLSPGKYKLTLQASNAGNEFNSPEKIVNYHYQSSILANMVVPGTGSSFCYRYHLWDYSIPFPQPEKKKYFFGEKS